MIEGQVVPPDASVERPSRWRRAWPAARLVAGLALGLLALYVIDGRRGELSGAESYLERIRPAWLVAAAAAELGAIVSFAALQRRLLRSGGVRVGLGPITAITLAGNSVNNSLPAGPAFATLYAFRQYRLRGADETLAGWTVLATALSAGAALAVLAAAGLGIAGGERNGLDLVGATLAVLLAILAAGAIVVVIVWRLRASGAVLALAIRVSQRLVRRPRGDSRSIASSLLGRLAAVTPTRPALAAVLAYAMGNWVLDCACLAFSFLAVGAPVPWQGLLLAYGAAQLASNLPVTPGGLGVVEGSLTIALVAYGGAGASTVAAVLLYRVFNFWGSLPVGWGAWAVLEVQRRLRHGRLAAGEGAHEAVVV